jgi:hypothetical protein
MTIRIQDDPTAVLPAVPAKEPFARAEPPAALAELEAEWLAHLDSLPPYRGTFRERIVSGLRRVWDGPPERPLTQEEMDRIMRPRESDYLPEIVPPDDPERLAWEAYLRSIGVRPATRWSAPIRTPVRRPTFWSKLKYRISQGW